jgi:hypothetical protein
VQKEPRVVQVTVFNKFVFFVQIVEVHALQDKKQI